VELWDTAFLFIGVKVYEDHNSGVLKAIPLAKNGNVAV